MMHGPYGILNSNALCMKDEKCFKKYSQNFQENTIKNENSYLIYKHSERLDWTGDAPLKLNE